MNYGWAKLENNGAGADWSKYITMKTDYHRLIYCEIAHGCQYIDGELCAGLDYRPVKCSELPTIKTKDLVK